MSIERKNTLVVDFGILPVRPDVPKIHQFLEKEIQLQLSEVQNIQLNSIRNCVFIEVKDSETAARYQKHHNNRHVIYHEDKGFKIPVYVESEAVPVRVLDLPPAMKHTTVIDFLTQYGEVKSVTRERWKNFFPGIYNGVRVLHMKLKQQIPSFVTILGHLTGISYPGQQKSCRWCERAAHPGQKCNTSISKNQTPSTSTTAQTFPPSSEKECLLNPDHFPPLNQTIPKSSSPEQNELTTVPTTRDDNQQKTTTEKHENANDDNDGDDSTSSDGIDTSNKRRRSARLANERKKICSSQASLNSCQSSVDSCVKRNGISSDKIVQMD